MKRAIRIIGIGVYAAFAAFVALYSAMGFFDVLWRGSALFEAVVVGLIVVPVISAVQLTRRVWR